jgi:hypothetical protein
VLTSLTRNRFSFQITYRTSWYLWINGFLLVVALLEVTRGRRPSRWVVGASALIVVVGAVTLVGNLRTYHEGLLNNKRAIHTFMVATEAIPDHINRRRIIPVSFVPVHTGEYLTAVKQLGTPIKGIRLSDLGNEHDRRIADSWMIHDLGLRFEAIAAPPARGCTAESPATAAHDLAVQGPGPVTIVMHAGTESATWSLRRLATRFAAPQGELRPGALAALTIPADHSRFPWHLRVQGLGTTLASCP